MKILITRTAIAIAVSLPGAAVAQQHPAIERCMQTDSDADRIACLEATILAISAGKDFEPDVVTEASPKPEPEVVAAEQETAVDRLPEPIVESSPEPMVESSPEPIIESSMLESSSAPMPESSPEAIVAASPASTVESAPESPANQTAALSYPDPAPDMAPVAAETALPAEEQVSAAAAEAEVLDTADETDIGREQVDARTQTREEKQVSLSEARGLRVERFGKVGFRQLQVYLENGQIWRQIKGDVQEIRVTVERNPTVDITESALGGYKLRLNEMRRTIRVQRIR